MSYVDDFYVTYKKNQFYLELRQDRPTEKSTVGIFYMKPEDAKGLGRALRDMMDSYERDFGKVEATKLEESTTEPPKSTWKGIA